MYIQILTLPKKDLSQMKRSRVDEHMCKIADGFGSYPNTYAFSFIPSNPLFELL